MEQIIPTNLDNELEQLRKHIKRIKILDNIANIAIIIVAISATIAIWITLNQRMGNQAWQEGYDRGYEQSQWDFIDREINSQDYGTIRMEPSTDAEIWEKYHDCDMYGLPEYARPYCEEKAQES